MKMRELDIHMGYRTDTGDPIDATITVVFATESAPMVPEIAAGVHVMTPGDNAHALMFAMGATEREALLAIASRWEAMAHEILRVAESLPMEAADGEP